MANQAATDDNMYADLAYWQTRAYDMQNEINSLEAQRENKRKERLNKVREQLRAAQEELKYELA